MGEESTQSLGSQVEVFVRFSKYGSDDVYLGNWLLADGYYWARPSLNIGRTKERQFNIFIVYYPDPLPKRMLSVVLHAPEIDFSAEEETEFEGLRSRFLFTFSLPDDKTVYVRIRYHSPHQLKTLADPRH